MKKKIFVSEENPVSHRWAVFDEDENAGWLYLTEVQSTKPIADCWIYNLIPAPKNSEIERFKPNPPPAPIEFVKDGYLQENLTESSFKFIWSKDGHSVAILINNVPTGYIILGEKRGYSKNLLKDCPWGNVFNEDSFQLHFGKKQIVN